MIAASSCALLLLLLTLATPARAASFEQVARQFMESDFVFSRAKSDAPFVPLAWIDLNSYQASTIRQAASQIRDLSLRQTSLSEATLLPVLLGPRDALLVGQWGSWTRL